MIECPYCHKSFDASHALQAVKYAPIDLTEAELTPEFMAAIDAEFEAGMAELKRRVVAGMKERGEL